MRVIIAILFLTLAGGYILNHYFITDPDLQWYCYFVVNDLKAFLIALALSFVTWKTPAFIYAALALTICSFDLITQVLDVNIKGSWADFLYKLLLAYIFVDYKRLTKLKIWTGTKIK